MVHLTRYTPLNNAVSFRNAMDRLFEEGFISPRSGLNAARGGNTSLYETAEGYTLQVPLPGVRPEDVEITVQQDTISLKWSNQVSVPEGTTVHWQGYQSGKYQQTFTLPATINSEGVEAHTDAGILTVQLPKAEHARTRTIRVQPRQ